MLNTSPLRERGLLELIGMLTITHVIVILLRKLQDAVDETLADFHLECFQHLVESLP